MQSCLSATNVRSVIASSCEAIQRHKGRLDCFVASAFARRRASADKSAPRNDGASGANQLQITSNDGFREELNPSYGVPAFFSLRPASAQAGQKPMKPVRMAPAPIAAIR